MRKALVTRSVLGLALLLGTSSAASALTLGRMDVRSVVGQPLLAEIPLDLLDGEDVGALRVSVGSANDYRVMNLHYGTVPPLIKPSLVMEGDHARIVLRTDAPLEEPYFNLVLRTSLGEGYHYRSYSVFIDLPSKTPDLQLAVSSHLSQPEDAASPRSADKVVRPAAQPAPTLTAPQASSKGATVLTPPLQRSEELSAPPPPGVAGQYGPVRRGESLSVVADKALGGDPGYSHYQAVMALFQKNPQHFLRANLNGLKQGVMLALPQREEILAIGEAQARSAFIEHRDIWMQASRRSPSPLVVNAKPELPREAPPPTGAAAPDVAALEKRVIIEESGHAEAMLSSAAPAREVSPSPPAEALVSPPGPAVAASSGVVPSADSGGNPPAAAVDPALALQLSRSLEEMNTRLMEMAAVIREQEQDKAEWAAKLKGNAAAGDDVDQLRQRLAELERQRSAAPLAGEDPWSLRNMALLGGVFVAGGLLAALMVGAGRRRRQNDAAAHPMASRTGGDPLSAGAPVITLEQIRARDAALGGQVPPPAVVTAPVAPVTPPKVQDPDPVARLDRESRDMFAGLEALTRREEVGSTGAAPLLPPAPGRVDMASTQASQPVTRPMPAPPLPVVPALVPAAPVVAARAAPSLEVALRPAVAMAVAATVAESVSASPVDTAAAQSAMAPEPEEQVSLSLEVSALNDPASSSRPLETVSFSLEGASAGGAAPVLESPEVDDTMESISFALLGNDATGTAPALPETAASLDAHSDEVETIAFNFNSASLAMTSHTAAQAEDSLPTLDIPTLDIPSLSRESGASPEKSSAADEGEGDEGFDFGSLSDELGLSGGSAAFSELLKRSDKGLDEEEVPALHVDFNAPGHPGKSG
ncbi:MAG: hypothetical protein H7831_15120 [Magnetococcus sp. WYHC-3]